jgi:hypothetical protein
MVLPRKQTFDTPHPRPDQPLIQKVHDYLAARRPLATELYVIACEYIPIALSVGITVKAGFGHDQVNYDVRKAVQAHLAPLPPYGPAGEGWPLGRSIKDRELEVVVGRIKGVNTVSSVNLFQRRNNQWRQIGRVQQCEAIEIDLDAWQLPEVLVVLVSTDGVAPDTVTGAGVTGEGTEGGGTAGGVAVPVVPEAC